MDKKRLYGIAGFLGDCCTIFNYLGNGVFCLFVFDEGYTDVENACTGFTMSGQGTYFFLNLGNNGYDV